MFRRDTWIGAEHFWICHFNGHHEVRRETYGSEPDNKTVYTGTYYGCLQFLEQLEANQETF